MSGFCSILYKDILSVKQLFTDQQTYKEHRIRTIDVHSFESDEQPSKDFFCEKKISKDYRQMDTYTKSTLNGKSLLSSYFDNKGYLIKSEDSSDLSVSVSTYQYDVNGNLLSITSISRSNDDDYVTSMKEVHQFTYNDNGQPQKMLLIKNQKDTTETDFIEDNKGNITDEIEVALGGRHFYYYYDDKNRLTDIVRFNTVKNRLLPDFIFNYNDQGQLSEMVISQEGVNPNYYTWKYVYDDGLRIKEKCFSKAKALLGYLEYEYIE